MPSWADFSDLPTGPLARLGHFLPYDPTNERIILLGGQSRTVEGEDPWTNLHDVWAYDLPTNTWIELVPASSQ